MADTFDAALDDAHVDSTSVSQEIQGTANGHEVTAEVVESGPIGMRVRALTITRPDGNDHAVADDSPESSRQTAERLVDRITYLEEPLGILECDPEGDVVQIRSTPPNSQGGRSEYYELEVGSNRQTLARFRGGTGPREQIPFDLTRHSLRRIVRDMTGD
jgi:hypothetical protein